jgi:hypothetical protein
LEEKKITENQMYLFFRTKTYIETWSEIWGISKRVPEWKEMREGMKGWFFRRANGIQQTGVHWHCVIKLPGVLDLFPLNYMLNRGRQANCELRRRISQNNKVDDALEYVRQGYLCQCLHNQLLQLLGALGIL